MGAKELLFNDEWLEFYYALDEVQKIHFWELASRHAEFQLNDVCNVIEKEEKVIKNE